MLRKIAVLLTLGLLAATAYHATYTVHEKYKLPFHADEWDHLTLGLHLARRGSLESIRAYNPYTGLRYRTNREPGYHLLIGLLYILVGILYLRG